MKRILTIAVIGILSGCTTTHDGAESFFNGENDAINDVKDPIVAAGAAVKQQTDEAADHAENFSGAEKDGIYESVDHVADWMRPSKPKPPQHIAASYCYHVLQDILCYRQPMPGWEGRLAGYQPLGAPPPPAAMMQPLPQHVVDASQLPANRVAASKPVFSQLPAAAATDKAPEDGSAPVSGTNSVVTHEQLPDPAMAPQL